MESSAAIDVDFLDTEFSIYLQIAQNLLRQIRLAEDKRVCAKYIQSCLNMKESNQLKVKFHRNRFFRYLLKTMKRAVDTQGSYFVHLVNIWRIFRLDFNSMTLQILRQPDINPEGDPEKNEWSSYGADNKSYVAAKIIPGYGTLIYMACTDNPKMGWEQNGFANFVEISSVPNLPVEEPEQQQQQNPQPNL